MIDKICKILNLEVPVTTTSCCDKTDCISYSKWEVCNDVPMVWQLPQAWAKNKKKIEYSFSQCSSY